MRQWLSGAGAVMIVVWIITPTALAKGRFDGDWNVILSTKEGRCPRFYEFPVTIREGAIRGTMEGVRGRYAIKGRVAKDGSFSWGWGHSTGKLSDKEGAGLWVTTAGVRSGNCSGEISLQRKQ